MFRSILFVSFLALIRAYPWEFGSVRPLPEASKWAQTPITDFNFEEPVFVDFSRDGRIWVVERPGRIRYIYRDQPSNYGVVWGDFRNEVSASADRGLLGDICHLIMLICFRIRSSSQLSRCS
jgi:hypothetical protein